MYFVSPPPADVAPWVECLWELCTDRAEGWQEVVPAELSSDLVVSVGTPYRRSGTSGEVEGAAQHHLGVRCEPERFFHGASNRLFGVRLRPGAAHQLFGVGGSMLGEHGDPRDLALRPFRGLTERVAEALRRERARGPAVDRPALRSVLLEPLRGLARHCAGPPWVAGVLDVIRTEDCFRVAELSQRTGITERTLERRFKDQLGVSPKFAARLVRVQRASAALSAGRSAAAVASELGFSDQSHLCGETRRLLGFSPSGERFEPPVCRISPRPPGPREPGTRGVPPLRRGHHGGTQERPPLRDGDHRLS